ncbi:WxL domain-containing protein, partial [Enterococcus sp.]|uniref:WxL domain-containing protein n=1 Tax=Enterococcus sp. TaxID=35783 RepID=UPI0025BC51FB
MRVSKAVLKAITLSSMLALGGTYASATEHTNPEPSEATTSLQGKLNLSENGGHDPNPPSDLNKKTTINNSYFGISYVPETFDFSSVKLEDTVGSQTINALKSKSTEESRTSEKTFNIGVKDKRRVSTNDWTLYAKLNSEIGEDTEGMSISIDSNTNKVKRNMNDGEKPFQPQDLTNQVEKTGKEEVAKMDSVTLTQENKPVMYTTGEQFVNGVYDLELENVSLTIPDASKAKAQNISTSIQWTLESTPMKSDYIISEVKNLFKDPQCKKLKMDDLSYDMVQRAAEAIKEIQDPDQKKYNEEYLKVYVLDSYAEWTLKGFKNTETHTFGTMKFFRSPDEQKAALT